jgi:hypothetical protein
MGQDEGEFTTYWSRLNEPGSALGVSCDIDGPSIGPIRLLKRTAFGLEPRSLDELDFVLSHALGYPIDMAPKLKGLNAVANALENQNLAKAALITQFMWLPSLMDEADLGRAIKADALLKAGFNPDQSRDEHGRWTDSGESIGGRVSTKPERATSLPAGYHQISEVCTNCHAVVPAIPPAWQGPFDDLIYGPRPAFPDVQNSSGFKDALSECHSICVEQFKDNVLQGTRGFRGSDAPSQMRRCIRECLESKGYENF